MEAVGGAIFTVAAVQEFRQQVLPVCEQVDSSSMNWTQFDKILKTLWDKDTRMELVEDDVMFNGQVITDDLRAALEALEDGDYIDFGIKLGTTLDAATNGDQTLFLY